MEPNAYFEPLFYERQKNTTVKMEKFLLAKAEDMKELEDNSFDIVVSTLVLCSVTDLNATLREIHRVLAPVCISKVFKCDIHVVLILMTGWKILLLGTRTRRTWNLAPFTSKSADVHCLGPSIWMLTESKYRPHCSSSRKFLPYRPKAL